MRLSSQKLLEAFVNLLNQKSLAKITTLDLIGTAHISRSTFYRHFQDKFDFFEWVKSFLLDLFLKDDYSQDTPVSFYTRFFQHFSDYRPAFKSFILEGNWQDFENQILASGIQNYTILLSRFLDRHIPIKIIASYIVSAHIGVAMNWLKEDDPHSPEEMASILTKLTNSVLINYGISFQEFMSI